MSLSCSTDSDCDFNFYCSSNDQCVHKGIWPPNAVDVITYIIIPFLVGVANVGGIGGGIVKMPLLVLILNYQPKEATFLSYCLLFGGCLANSFLLLFKKHPTKDKPIIDYNITLIINPTVLLGTNIGIFLNVLLPELAAGLLFIVFLISISPYLFKKGMNMLKLKKMQQKVGLDEKLIEDQQQKIELGEAAIEETESGYNRGKSRQSKIQQDLDIQRSSSYYAPKEGEEQQEQRRQSVVARKISSLSVFSDSNNDNQTNNTDLDDFYREESQQIPYKKLGLLVSIFFTVQFFVFLRGGKGLKSFVGITTCSVTYWIACACILLVAIIASFIIRFFIVKWDRERKEIIKKYNLQKDFEDDFDYTPLKTYLKIWIAGLGAGCLAGTFGVGAGLALVPLLLAEGIHPQIVAATCGFNYFFISSTTIIQVFTNDYLSIYQIILYSFLSFVGGFFVASYIYKLVDRKKAGHIIAFIVLGLAFLNIVAYVIYLTRKGINQGTSSLIDQPSFCSQ